MDVGKWDAVVHLDAEELEWVYGWRVEQERGLRGRGGGSMTDEEVKAFGELGVFLFARCGFFSLFVFGLGGKGRGWERGFRDDDGADEDNSAEVHAGVCAVFG